MSETAIFAVGIVVFAVTVWGTVMAGGYWLGEVATSDEDQAGSGTDSPPPESQPR